MISAEVLTKELSRWLDEHWDPQLSLLAWRERLVDGRWARPSWPVEWFGRGLTVEHDRAVLALLDRLRIPGPPVGAATRLVAPTLLAHGSDELRGRLLRPILTGEHTWCQLFSEPGSGSDLAGLTTRAERGPGDGCYVVNGQKLWSTSADHAVYGMLLARTDPSVPKHQGITYFAFPMQQAGVEVQPLRQMNGHASFNEVFLTDARVGADLVVGAPGEGWAVARTTLANERRLADHAVVRERPDDGLARAEAAAERRAYAKTYGWYPQRAGRPDLAVRAGRASGDVTLRQEAARLHSEVRVAEWTAQRNAAALARGTAPTAVGSLSKLASSRIARRASDLHGRAAGAGAMLTGEDSPLGGIVAEVLVSVPAASIAGGTDEVQKNIVGERLLGLPR